MKVLITLFASLALGIATFAAEPSPPGAQRSPLQGEGQTGTGFQELYDLLRKNLPGVTEAELDQAAAQGLIKQLYPLVTLVTNNKDHASGSATNIGPHTSILEGAYAYFRFNEIADDIDKEFSTAFKRIASTNRLRGLVLDLRFAGGSGPSGYDAAGALADPFLPARLPMIDWGEGPKLSTTKTNQIHMPIAILVNKETRGAAEAFAAILRRSDIGLLLGDNTAGQAAISREFTLKNGQKLSVAATPVKIAGTGTPSPVPRNGLTPDIKVEVPLAEERAFLQDAYRPIPRLAAGRDGGPSLSATNQVAGGTNRNRRRINEAELVRMQREGIDLDPDLPTGRESGPLRPPVITDPVLARAIDLLKGLSVVNQFRASER